MATFQARTILKQIGDAGLVELVNGNGYWYFVFDLPEQNAYETHSVYTTRLTDLSLDAWVAEGKAFAAKCRADMAARAEHDAKVAAERATARQEIAVDALGRAVSAYKDDNPVALSVLGPQRITRFSEVLHDDEKQGFYVYFKEAAPEEYQDTVLWKQLLDEAGHTDREAWVSVPLGQWAFERDHRVLFPTYTAAVKAEQAVLSLMMRRGELRL